MGEERRGKTLALENYQQPKKSDLSDLALAIEEPLESTLQEEGVEGQQDFEDRVAIHTREARNPKVEEN